MLSSFMHNEGKTVSSLGQGCFFFYKCMHAHATMSMPVGRTLVSAVMMSRVRRLKVGLRPFCLSAGGAAGYVHGYQCTLSRQLSKAFLSLVQPYFTLDPVHLGKPKIHVSIQCSVVAINHICFVLTLQSVLF